jgi:hypothetical protein
MLPAYLRQLQSSGKKRVFWWSARRPPVRKNPVLWKERYVEGIAPLPLLRVLPTWVAALVVFSLTALAYGRLVLDYLGTDRIRTLLRGLSRGDAEGYFDLIQGRPIPTEEFVWRGVCVLLIAGLVVGIRCSGAITGERERKTWEALLLTPLEIRHLIRGKFWGILGATTPYLVAFAVPALICSMLGGISALFLTALFTGVTWLGMAYVGAAGIWCSVRSKSSWRSLLMTLVLAYVGGTVLYCVASPLIGILVFLLMMIVISLDAATGGAGILNPASARFFDVIPVAFALGLATAFAVAAWRFLASAEYRVGIVERAKHWRKRSRGRPRRRRYEDDDD